MNDLEQDIKELIIKSLNLEDLTVADIDSNEPIFGDGLGLDSIDALELGIAIKKQYSLTLDGQSEENQKYFSC